MDSVEPMRELSMLNMYWPVILAYGSMGIRLLWYGFLVYATIRGLRYVDQYISITEEKLRFEKQRAVQVDEALALLKSINENLAHRTAKN